MTVQPVWGMLAHRFWLFAVSGPLVVETYAIRRNNLLNPATRLLGHLLGVSCWHVTTICAQLTHKWLYWLIWYGISVENCVFLYCNYYSWRQAYSRWEEFTFINWQQPKMSRFAEKDQHCSTVYSFSVLCIHLFFFFFFFSCCRVDSIMLVEEGFDVVSVDASDKMLKYALKSRWERRKEPAFDQWGTAFY